MILLQRRDDYSPPDGFWTASEQLSWPANHNDIYNVFPTITFYFPLHADVSMQFGVTMPPQVRSEVAIVIIVLLLLSVVAEVRLYVCHSIMICSALIMMY